MGRKPSSSGQGQAQSFPKSVRLRKSPEFDRVYRSKHYAADGTLVICGARNQSDATRLGLSVSRKVGNAVVRNRWKRLIREAFRKQQVDLPSGLDLVVRPKKGATCDGAAIARSIRKLAIRLDRSIPADGASEKAVNQ
jgi:ribonuclease P protein component